MAKPFEGHASRSAAVRAFLDDGMTTAEIAERMGISVRGVQQAMRYARKGALLFCMKLPEPTRKALETEAARRRISPTALALDLLESVAVHGRFAETLEIENVRHDRTVAAASAGRVVPGDERRGIRGVQGQH